MNYPEIKQQLITLGKAGCKGSVQDFHSWLKFHNLEQTRDSVGSALTDLVSSGEFLIQSDTGDFAIRDLPDPGMTVEYEVPSNVADSPIQMVRSRLESFLRYHNADEEQEVDLIVGVTEAMENAVKYGAPSTIHIKYELSNDEFYIEIINQIMEPSAESDILLGKYNDSSRTLMRGIMMMQKLFSEMDLNMDEENSRAILTARGRVR